MVIDPDADQANDSVAVKIVAPAVHGRNDFR